MPKPKRDGRGVPLPMVVVRLAGCDPEAFVQSCPRPVLLEIPSDVRLPAEPTLSPIATKAERDAVVKGRLRCLARGHEPPNARLHAFPASPALLGSDPRCTLFVAHADVSARHARLEQGARRWEVMDLESRRGTVVEGRRLPVGVPAPLAGGELLAVGGLRFLVLFPRQLHGLVRAVARQRERRRRADLATGPLPNQGVPWTALAERTQGPNRAAFEANHAHPFLVQLEPRRQGAGVGLPFDPAEARVFGIQPRQPSGTVLVGRSSDADVLVTDLPTISTRHAELRPTRTGWGVMDLESSNGTFLDGRRLPPGVLTPVRPGQVLAFSVYRCRFEEPAALLRALAAPPPAAPLPTKTLPPPAAEARSLAGVAALQDLLVRHETEGNTGTLRVHLAEPHPALGGSDASLAFRYGRLVAVEAERGDWRTALQVVCLAAGAAVRFEPNVLPQQTPLDLSIYTYLCTELGTAQILRAGLDAMHQSRIMRRQAG